MLTEKSLEQLLKEKLISQRTYDKVLLSKQYIERKYNFKIHKNNEMKNFIEKLFSHNIDKEKINKIKNEIYEKEMNNYRKARQKQSIRDYESIAIIGRGAFGEVHVCKEKKTGNIVAIKKIKKDNLISNNQIIHVRNEQLFMSSVKSSWIVDLKASFQEDDYLYLVMEYCPGGDLMNLLIEKDILTEEEAKFYLAELILSIESIHKLDCIHRDIKPDNILIDSTGHIKLSDFGLAKVSEKIYENRLDINSNTMYHHNKNYSCVGTAYYVAPEVLNKTGYGPEIDWWSAGIIFYEMLVGYAPFCSKDTSEVCYKVLNWKKYFKIPSKVKLSSEAKDLINKLINSSNKRLGKNGAEEIKKHPFFKDLDWDNIRTMKPPFIPKIKNEHDTKYFEIFEENEPFYPTPKKYAKRKDIEYLGYTYKVDNDLYNGHKIIENNYFNNIKNLITEENKTSFTKNSSSGSRRFSSINNQKVNSKKSSFSTSKNTHRNTRRNDDSPKKNSINKNTKLNVIQLPKKKSKMNINKKEKNDSINNTINGMIISSRIINNNIKINLGKVGKYKNNIRRFSPKPKQELILKILNISKNKNLEKKKNKSVNKSKNNNNNNNKNLKYNRSVSNSNRNKIDTNFNYNCSLLKKLLKKTYHPNSNKRKTSNKKNNITIIKNVHNQSYNN